MKYSYEFKKECVQLHREDKFADTPEGIKNGINGGQLYSWANKYKNYGYNSLVNKKKGRKSKNTKIKRKNNHKPKELNESEREELIKLRAEN